MNKLPLAIAAMITAAPAYAEETNEDSYFGIYTGFSATSPDYSETPTVGFGRNPSMDGVAAGFYAGRDLKTEGVLIGVEADIGLLHNAALQNPAGTNWYTAFESRWNAHLRTRVGFKTGKATKLYAAGGLSLLNMVTDDTDPEWGSVTTTHIGWTLGGGIEHRVGPKLSFRAEFLHDKFRAHNGNISYQGLPYYNIKTNPSTDTIRVGIAYRF